MMNKCWLLAPALLSACAACAPPPPMQPMGSNSVGRHGTQVQRVNTRKADYCDKTKCEVEITVDAKCGVTATPYALVMGGEARHHVEITWKIASGNAQFASKDPIVFREAQAKRVFTRKHAGADEVVFDNTGAYGIYHYDVSVTQDGTTCPTLDPTGVNDM